MDDAQHERLDRIADAFGAAWLHGEWDAYFALWADEFVFEYPAPPFTGRWTGDEARARRDEWRSTFENARLTTTGEDLRLHDGDWVVVCNHGEGVVRGKPYRGLLTTVFHRMDAAGKVVEYREFLGGMQTSPQASNAAVS